jgi:hypothetical protein
LLVDDGPQGSITATHGPALQLPALPVITPVTFQLLRDGGAPLARRFTVPRMNTATRFKALSD